MRFNITAPSPFVIGVTMCAVAAVTPLLITDSLVTSLTATPLRRAASTFVILTIGGVVALWAVSRASLRAANAVESERTQGGQS